TLAFPHSSPTSQATPSTHPTYAQPRLPATSAARVPSRRAWHTPCTTSRTRPTRKETTPPSARRVTEQPASAGNSGGGDSRPGAVGKVRPVEDAPQARCARKASALRAGHDLDTGSALPPCRRQRQVVQLPVTVGWSDEVGGDTMIEAHCRAPTPPNPAPDPPFPIPPTPEPSPTPEPRPMPPV